jgi:hypothetical protein
MLDLQREDFTGRERFGHLLLGLLSLGERVTALSAQPNGHGTAAAPSKLADFLLGVIATHRSLHAVLAMEQPKAQGEPATAARRSPQDPTLLR